MAYVNSSKANGQLLAVVLSVEGEEEASIYRKLLKEDLPKCPKCGKELNPKDEHLMLRVSSPLTPMFGMELGTPVTVCQECGGTIIDETTVDLTAYPSAMKFLMDLRKQYQARMSAAMRQQRGGSTGGKR